MVRALPGGKPCRTLIDDVRGTPRSMTIEIDLAALPPGSTGVALLPESPFADGSGLLENVGVIRSLAVVAESEGADILLGVALRSENLQETLHEFRLRREDGAGLRTLVAWNPLYIEEVRHREKERMPLYPQQRYSLAFLGFTVRLEAPASTGRLLLRIKEVRLSYDQAVIRFDEIVPGGGGS